MLSTTRNISKTSRENVAVLIWAAIVTEINFWRERLQSHGILFVSPDSRRISRHPRVSVSSRSGPAEVHVALFLASAFGGVSRVLAVELAVS